MRKFRKYTVGPDCPKICIIGAGFSGICAALQLKRKLNFTDFTIYDSNSDVGGCWFSNSYPGSACSIPSHLYNYSFAPKSDWSELYAGQLEIQEYLKSTARKFDVYNNIKLGHEVKKLIWNEKLNKWTVHIFNKETKVESEILYDIIINGSGQLRIPQKPKEFLNFKGPVVHTAEWDNSVDLEGKRVAVIGAGASAVQLIPHIAKKASKLLAYQRHPIWLTPGFQIRIPAALKWSFARIPGLRSSFKYLMYVTSDIGGMRLIHRGRLTDKCLTSMVTSIAKLYTRFEFRKYPELIESLAPTHPLGCKVPGLSDDYYSTFKLPHVKSIKIKIDEVREHSIVTEDGIEEEIDVILLATGFRSQDFFAPMEIVGKDSENIFSKWKKDGPSAFLGIASSCMPNNFILFGPGTTVLHTSLIFQIESQVHFVIEVLKEMMKRKAKVVAVKESAELEYMREMQEAIKETVFGAPDCVNVPSWYLDSRMVNTAIYPKSCRSYKRRTRRVDDSKFDFI